MTPTPALPHFKNINGGGGWDLDQKSWSDNRGPRKMTSTPPFPHFKNINGGGGWDLDKDRR